MYKTNFFGISSATDAKKQDSLQWYGSADPYPCQHVTDPQHLRDQVPRKERFSFLNSNFRKDIIFILYSDISTHQGLPMWTGLISIGFLGLGAGPTATRDSPSCHTKTKIMNNIQMHACTVHILLIGMAPGYQHGETFFTFRAHLKHPSSLCMDKMLKCRSSLMCK